MSFFTTIKKKNSINTRFLKNIEELKNTIKEVPIDISIQKLCVDIAKSAFALRECDGVGFKCVDYNVFFIKISGLIFNISIDDDITEIMGSYNLFKYILSNYNAAAVYFVADNDIDLVTTQLIYNQILTNEPLLKTLTEIYTYRPSFHIENNTINIVIENEENYRFTFDISLNNPQRGMAVWNSFKQAISNFDFIDRMEVWK